MEFKTKAALAEWANDQTMPEIAAYYNELPGVKPVKKFESRDVAVTRIWATLSPDKSKVARTRKVARKTPTSGRKQPSQGRLRECWMQAGYADTDSSQWEFISLPAIATEDGDAVGRKKGEALWPGKRMLEELQILERTMPLADWARGYQQIILEDLGIGRCYPDYDPVDCMQPGEWDYESPIHVGIDFNADPMSGEIFMISKVPLPGWTNQFETVARGLDEVIVETTEMSVFAEALMGRLCAGWDSCVAFWRATL